MRFIVFFVFAGLKPCAIHPSYVFAMGFNPTNPVETRIFLVPLT